MGIPGVASKCRDPESFRTKFDTSRQVLCGSRALGISVVLQYEKDRDSPLGCDVQGLIDNAFSQCAVPQEDDNDFPAPGELLRICHPGGYGRDTALNAVAEDSAAAD